MSWRASTEYRTYCTVITYCMEYSSNYYCIYSPKAAIIMQHWQVNEALQSVSVPKPSNITTAAALECVVAS